MFDLILFDGGIDYYYCVFVWGKWWGFVFVLVVNVDNNGVVSFDIFDVFVVWFD